MNKIFSWVKRFGFLASFGEGVSCTWYPVGAQKGWDDGWMDGGWVNLWHWYVPHGDILHIGKEPSYPLRSPKIFIPNKVRERKEWAIFIHRNTTNMILLAAFIAAANVYWAVSSPGLGTVYALGHFIVTSFWLSSLTSCSGQMTVWSQSFIQPGTLCLGGLVPGLRR